MTRRSTLLLDMDGLMIDSERLYWAASRKLAATQGRTVSDDTLRSMMGRHPRESVRLLAEAAGLTGPLEALQARRDALYVELLEVDAQPMPGLQALLDAVQGRLRCAVVTSSPGDIAARSLEKLGIADRFELVQSSDDVEQGKPHPEIYVKAMDRLGVRASECVVLEDSENGARAAARAGAYVVAVPNDHTRGGHFDFVDFVAADLHEALAQLERLM